jgi:uncharacterized protein YjbI with pentapeptide repeats
MGSVLHRLFSREPAAPPKQLADEAAVSESVSSNSVELPLDQPGPAPEGSTPAGTATAPAPESASVQLSSAESAALFMAQWDAEPTQPAPPLIPDIRAHTTQVESTVAAEAASQNDDGASATPEPEASVVPGVEIVAPIPSAPLDEPQTEEKPALPTPTEALPVSAPQDDSPGSGQTDPPSLNFVDSPRVDPDEWRLEEALATHHEWIESKGVSGKKVNFAGAQFADKELISADLRYADLQEANLRSADLLLADLRGACLARAQLDEACLVGTNLEGANLEGASLSTAMGLLPRQVAGADLYNAQLPANVAEFSALPQFNKAAQMAARYFTTTWIYCLASWLLIWKTRDAQLLTDSAVLPYVHATTALPTAEFYLISPAVLLILYLVFHFNLQQAWEKLMELPAVFPDGRDFGEDAPRIVMGLARSHFYWLSPDSPSARFIEKWTVRILAYWLAPFTLLLYWARYLTLQEFHGTLLHEALVVGATGVALYSTQRIGRPAERWILHPGRDFKLLAKLKTASLPWLLASLALFLTFLSVGTMIGVPHDPARAPQYGSGSFRRWASNILWAAGVDPYANLTEASLSLKPLDGNGDDSQLAAIKGPHLNQSNLRYAQAYGAFLPSAHLWRANLEGAYLSRADLRASDLTQVNLHFAILDSTQFEKANLDHASLDAVTASRADFRGANLSYVTFDKAQLVDARFDGASLYSSHLGQATMIRANLEKADLRDAWMNDSNLSHADLQQAYLWSAKLERADLGGAQLQGAILIDSDLNEADLRGAVFEGTVMNDAILTGAQLDGADLRGVNGLTPPQICSAKSRTGALMDDSLLAAVAAQCGGPVPQLASPAPSAAAAPQPTAKPNPVNKNR